MTSYQFSISCPHCGGGLDPVVSSKVCAGTECSAIARCVRCGREWQAQVTVRPVTNVLSQRRALRRERAAV